MINKLTIASAILSCAPVSLFAATATVNLAAGQLRDANGTIIADGGGTWAVIVAAGDLGNPQTAGALPGGLTNNASLTTLNLSQIEADFNGVFLTTGSKGSFYVHSLGTINGEMDIGFAGMVLTSIEFTISETGTPGFTSGTQFGLYWFPGLAEGSKLTGDYEVGGFANDMNEASGAGDWGTTIPATAALKNAQFYETNFNQSELSGPATDLSASRFTAVLVPETSTLTLSALGMAALLRRRRG